MKNMLKDLTTISNLEIRMLICAVFLLFIVFSILVFLFTVFNILNIEPLMSEFSQMDDLSGISEFIDILRERYRVPSDIQLIGSLYFDRYPAQYFEESYEKNIFRLLNIALNWGLSEQKDFYLKEMMNLAELPSTPPLLKYRYFLHIAIYYAYQSDKDTNRENLSLLKKYLDKAAVIPVPEDQKVDLYYQYAFYYYLERDYARSLNYINRTMSDDKFIDAKLLQLLVYISTDKNYYFYRMEACKLTNSIISSPEIEDMFIVLILKMLSLEMEKYPDNPFFHYFSAIFYQELNDTDKALDSARKFHNRYKKPVYDYFIEDNKHRIEYLERLSRDQNDRL